MENQIYIMSTNWAGEKNGGTVFCPPFIDGQMNYLEKLNDRPDVLTGIVDLVHLNEIRNKYPYLKDRSNNLDPMEPGRLLESNNQRKDEVAS